ncbi:hypothetical protein Agub_g13713 [Astrephomene gubernaculifera]|uniref:Uncharacterized protein n=1 Tax=Astrephomene gubernaculifera TaxID=47775 RepID=A0AAD3HSX5_9CHLO|nr:hypothetical protein Agub_g13713 [Astrephomene gubernaculifera]
MAQVNAGLGPSSSRTAAATRPSGVFVDAVTGRHACTSAAELLATRRLTWDKHFGWTYDAWIDDPAQYALSGANGRFSLPALALRLSTAVTQAASSAARFIQHQHYHHNSRQQQR